MGLNLLDNYRWDYAFIDPEPEDDEGTILMHIQFSKDQNTPVPEVLLRSESQGWDECLAIEELYLDDACDGCFYVNPDDYYSQPTPEHIERVRQVMNKYGHYESQELKDEIQDW